MRRLVLACFALGVVPGCGGELPGGVEGGVEPDTDLDLPAVDGDADLDADLDADFDSDDGQGDGGPDRDAEADPEVPPSCGFDYGEVFTLGLPPPPGSLEPPRGEPPASEDGVDRIAHAEPAPPGTFRLAPKDPDDPDLVMPAYDDAMPLFARGAAWAEARRCYETPAGVRLLTESEAWQLYRDVAELTTGARMDETPGVRSVVGLRGAYPGTFAWHGNAPNRFNDTIVLLWVDHDGVRHVREFPVNTDTGAHDFGLDSSSSLRPNRRYRYVNGWHRGYNALHIDEVGYRVRDDSNHNGHWDSDRNGWLPPRTADDRFRAGGGHNIHMGSVEPPLGSAAVGVWSAGCQVIPGRANWTEFVYRAWTGEGDRVDYFLVDARDIDPEVFFGSCEPDGTHECPFRVETLPFTHRFDTAGWVEDRFDEYNCSAADESGPEVVYLLTTQVSGTLTATVDCVAPVDVDVHLLDGGLESTACLARAHVSFDYALTPGRYFVVVDTWADAAGEYAGPYTLGLALR